MLVVPGLVVLAIVLAGGLRPVVGDYPLAAVFRETQRAVTVPASDEDPRKGAPNWFKMPDLTAMGGKPEGGYEE